MTCHIQLLDMCRRLDALESTGFTDILEEAEVATLRVLMSVSLFVPCIRAYSELHVSPVCVCACVLMQIAWQQLQEDSKPK